MEKRIIAEKLFSMESLNVPFFSNNFTLRFYFDLGKDQIFAEVSEVDDINQIFSYVFQT